MNIVRFIQQRSNSSSSLKDFSPQRVRSNNRHLSSRVTPPLIALILILFWNSSGQVKWTERAYYGSHAQCPIVPGANNTDTTSVSRSRTWTYRLSNQRNQRPVYYECNLPCKNIESLFLSIPFWKYSTLWFFGDDIALNTFNVWRYYYLRSLYKFIATVRHVQVLFAFFTFSK